MNEYIKKYNKVLLDAKKSIEELKSELAFDAKDDTEAEKIKILGLNYEVALSTLIMFKDELEKNIEDAIKSSNHNGIKIVLNSDPIKGDKLSDNKSFEGNASAFVSDKDPVIVKTKSGKRIVLDEDPVYYTSPTGVRIELENDPDFKDRRTGNVIELDEDPSSIVLKTGRKIILDEDPVKKKLKTNHIIVQEFDPDFVDRRTGKKIVLKEDPNLDNVETPKLNNGKVIKLENDPDYVDRRTGTRLKLDEDPIEITISDEDFEEEIDA